MLSLLLLAVLAVLPIRDLTLHDRVDVLEVQHFFDERGKLVFEQLIGWDWKTDHEEIVFWKLIKSQDMLPQSDWQRGGCVVRFYESEGYRRVTAPHYRECWDQVDVEVQQREILAKEKRRGLRVK